MIYIEHEQTNPSLNHAIEAYFLKETDMSVFMLWQNRPSILIGRNQKLSNEVHLKACKEKNVQMIRRYSGGGAIYCDLLNMQYSFITDQDRSGYSFEAFAKPMVLAMQKLGLPAHFTGRNDIILHGKKISGNAQYRYKHRILHHGSLLFAMDLDRMNACLRAHPLKLKDKGISSIRSRVGLIQDYLDMDVRTFKQYIRDFLIDYYAISSIQRLDAYPLDKIHEYLADFPLLQDDVLNQSIPDQGVSKRSLHKKYPFGLVEYELLLDKDQVTELDISGDFFELAPLETFLASTPGMSLSQILAHANKIPDYIEGMKASDLQTDILSLLEGETFDAR